MFQLHLLQLYYCKKITCHTLMCKVLDVTVGDTVVGNRSFTATIIQDILLLSSSFLAPMMILKG